MNKVERFGGCTPCNTHQGGAAKQTASMQHKALMDGMQPRWYSVQRTVLGGQEVPCTQKEQHLCVPSDIRLLDTGKQPRTR